MYLLQYAWPHLQRKTNIIKLNMMEREELVKIHFSNNKIELKKISLSLPSSPVLHVSVHFTSAEAIAKKIWMN